MKTLALSKFNDLAYRAHLNTSFSPEKRRDQIIKDYSDELEEDLKNIPETEKEKYISLYEKYFSYWLSAKTRCLNYMITGPANFPVRRAEKANRAEENKYKEFRTWREKAHKAIAKKIESQKPLHVKEDEEFERLKRDILYCAKVIKDIDAGVERGCNRALFVSSIANKIKTVSNNGKVVIVRKCLDLITEINAQNKKPIISKNHSIWKLIDVSEEAKEEQINNKSRQSDEIILNGIRILNNYQAERVQIFFPDKPNEVMRVSLKSNGWKWSPSNMCWQRKLTSQALYDAKQKATNYINW